MHIVDRGDLGDHVHRHLVVVARRRRDVQAAEGVLASRAAPAPAGRRARPCPPRSSARGAPRPCPATRCPARARRTPADGGRLRRTRRCPSAAHYRPPGTIAAAERSAAICRRGGRDRGSTDRDGGAMSITASRQRVAVIDQMAAEWQSIGRSRSAVRALREVARRDPGLAALVLGTGRRTAAVPFPVRCRRPHAAGVGANTKGGGGSPRPGTAP